VVSLDGITPAISKGLCDVCLEGILKAKDKGLTVSCDLNYRAKLWKWGKKAGEVMPELVKHCDIAIGNEEDADKVFGIKAPDTDVNAGKVEAAKYLFVVESLKKRFPNLKMIAVTLRGSISASHKHVVRSALRRAQASMTLLCLTLRISWTALAEGMPLPPA